MLPPILAYHLIDQRLDAGIAWTTPKRFEKQIAWLAEAGYRTLSLSEYLQQRDSISEKRLVITFDDGYRSLMQYALPILSRYHFRATVFVIAGYIGRPNLWDVKFFLPRLQHLDWNELRRLIAAGWEIGSHSLHHDYLPSLTDYELGHDLYASRKILEDNLQTPVTHLSLPFGRGNERVFRAAREAGYVSVSTLGNPASILPNDIEIIPRRGVYLLDSMRSFRRRVLAPPDCKWQYWRQRTISAFSMGTVVVKGVEKNIGSIFLGLRKK
ncbi:MAG: polysaccharide deacetylase family protein [candidate division KSB1 bacterium]|nr:polysaccharide deacetylase family protein [candidate division KSB1 bacterium]MDZ7369470.1 polysaccharide deacetylase family protein [candidate division KSB1 bacterium]MDZ7407582.1 polysaccharide deacetylase family protein [candidate division KSB1 bacterium]